MKKIILAIALGLCSTAFSLPFNQKLSQNEVEKLQNGEVVIRNIDYPKNMCLQGQSAGIQKLISSIKETKPNYLAEIIQIKPVEGNENLPETIRAALENIQDYAGIPYWSVRHQRYWDLYETAEVKSRKDISETETSIEAELFMEPFGTINQPIYIEQTEDYLFYTSTNSNNLKWDGITVVKPYCMKSAILLFKDGDNWILYGTGGVRAPRVPFLTPRVETSFINRIKTFCNFIFTKMEAKISYTEMAETSEETSEEISEK